MYDFHFNHIEAPDQLKLLFSDILTIKCILKISPIQVILLNVMSSFSKSCSEKEISPCF